MPNRVLAVSDVFEALISDARIAAGMPVDEALEIMRRDAGSHSLQSRRSSALERGLALQLPRAA